MRHVGQLKKFPELAAIAEAIFAHKARFETPDGTSLTTRVFKKTLYAVDHGCFRYVEQNPNTYTDYARRAQEGIQILWVARTHRKIMDAAEQVQYVPCSEGWCGRVDDGEVFMK